LRFDGILEGRSANVRDAPVVTLHDDFLLQAGKGNGSVELGKGTVDEPPGERAHDDEKNGECPNEKTKDGPQAVSRPLEVKLECSGRGSSVQPDRLAWRL
jgi:hypothetical protein